MTNIKCISIPSSHTKSFIILHQKHLNETVPITRGSKGAMLRMSDWGAAGLTEVRCRRVTGRFSFLLRAYIYVVCDMKSYVATLGNFTSHVT